MGAEHEFVNCVTCQHIITVPDNTYLIVCCLLEGHKNNIRPRIGRIQTSLAWLSMRPHNSVCNLIVISLLI